LFHLGFVARVESSAVGLLSLTPYRNVPEDSHR
jgi:hypothetical protein